MTLLFDVKSLVLLADKNDDDDDGVRVDVVVVTIPVLIVERFGKELLSSNECPSDEPLVINDVGGFVERSLSDIVRESNGDCWDLIAESREFDDNNSRGMFEFGKVDPGPEYNDDGIIVPFASVTVDDAEDDDGFIWEILFRICWFNRPLFRRKKRIKEKKLCCLEFQLERKQKCFVDLYRLQLWTFLSTWSMRWLTLMYLRCLLVRSTCRTISIILSKWIYF